jgi:hypothetical protein
MFVRLQESPVASLDQFPDLLRQGFDALTRNYWFVGELAEAINWKRMISCAIRDGQGKCLILCKEPLFFYVSLGGLDSSHGR